ncbi:hypothetical protein P692DRAFT_20570365 [Suillus brevipes Sb2]|nr:hypothetical protein P692DRAFT_20570365 [Suillus brevipes Sb2]
MILLLCAVLSCVPLVCASLPSLNDTCIHTLDASNSPSHDSRTLWDILSSCGLTLFACTWTAIHPNISGVDDGAVRVTFDRLYLMFFSARKAAKDFNHAFGAQCAHDCRATWQSELAVALMGDIPKLSRSSSAEWTLTHGFFACMGGFVLYVDGEPRATLSPAELLRFVREGSVEMPTITKAEIEDRSKGDGISKCVAILQLVWFVAQLIARYAQGLPVTLLEIDTLGIATLACIGYGFWWKKPKDIRRPYIVHWKSEVTAPPRELYRMYHPGKRRSYVSPDLDVDRHMGSGLEMISMITFCVGGMIFGAIHCLSWNYLFQAHKDKTLWRVASVGMACSPLVVTFAGVVTSLLKILESEFELQSSLDTYDWMIWVWFAGMGGNFYMLSRVTIVVLVFSTLEFTITTSRCIRYSSLDQVYSTCNFVVS